ncbi:hypothetical protein [Actinoallomurus sp. NPDC050550]|uniref:hypothetical protein n=1 Tax=Actinoallomurus sp. NPDC050550 TaxID=3154937 RepID=UPI003411B2BA
MNTNARLHAELMATIDRAYEAADQTDGPTIRALLDDLVRAGVEQGTAASLSHAHRLALDATAALVSVVDTHRYGSHCSECGTTGLCRTLRGICEIFIPGDARSQDLSLRTSSQPVDVRPITVRRRLHKDSIHE